MTPRTRWCVLAAGLCLAFLVGCGRRPGRQSRNSNPGPVDAGTGGPAPCDTMTMHSRSDERETDTPPHRSPLVAPAVERLGLLFPDYHVTREFADPFPYLAVCDCDGRLLGFQVSSDHSGTTAEGYGGPVPVRVFLDASARVLGFEVLENEETPAYLKLALCDSLADRLRRYRPGGRDSIDAVTLATVTSDAIIGAVTGVADRVAGELVRPCEP